MKETKGQTWKETEWVGCEVFVLFVCLFAFLKHFLHYFLFYFVVWVCLFHPVLLWRERTQQSYSTAKECSLHSHQVDGWMLLKLRSLWARAEQELDTCLITVSCCFFCFLFCFVRKKKLQLCFWLLFFWSSCTGEKERLHQKPCKREDSPVLFCHFSPLYFIWDS